MKKEEITIKQLLLGILLVNILVGGYLLANYQLVISRVEFEQKCLIF